MSEPRPEFVPVKYIQFDSYKVFWDSSSVDEFIASLEEELNRIKEFIKDQKHDKAEYECEYEPPHPSITLYRFETAEETQKRVEKEEARRAREAAVKDGRFDEYLNNRDLFVQYLKDKAEWLAARK